MKVTVLQKIKKQRNIPKNLQEAAEESQLEKGELLSVIAFIKENMKTLATYGKQLKNHL